MAHIYDLAPGVKKPGYAKRKLARPGEATTFPETQDFQGMYKPCRFEGDVFDLEVTGTIPKDINGTFYRVQPDHRFPPLFEDDIHFNGDGNVTAIRIKDGHADFKQRYVHNERYHAETEARRPLFGKYRNPWTDNESVKGIIRTTSNTNVFFWRGMLLATKEDGPPYAMDPVTLETLGRYDFEGQVLAPTFTAHPKFDPESGEMVCFAYEAGGNGNDGSRDVVVWTIDQDGKKTEETWYEAPFAGMIHDMGLTKNYVVLPLMPLKVDVERMKESGDKFAWDPTEDQWYGLVPRRGAKSEDIVWFRSKNAFQGHVCGAYEDEEGKVVLDLTVADGNVFFWWPPENPPENYQGDPSKFVSPMTRWVFDPKAKSGTVVEPAYTFPTTNGEFSRIDDRWTTKKYTHFWMDQTDTTKPYDFEKCGPPAGGLFNCMAHFTWDPEHPEQEGKKDVWWAGPTSTFQEPAFIPKDGGAEGEGYLIVLMNHLDILRNDVVIFDAQHVAQGPVAVLHLPLKLKLGLHGNFVDHRDIEAWQKRRDAQNGDVGPVQIATQPLPWQQQSNGADGLPVRQNGTNGATNGHH